MTEFWTGAIVGSLSAVAGCFAGAWIMSRRYVILTQAEMEDLFKELGGQTRSLKTILKEVRHDWSGTP